MKAAVLHKVASPMAIEELDMDRPKTGEVVVKWAAAGLCHSDLHFVKGEKPHPLPVVLGHEGAGIVEEVGAGVTRVKQGDHVIGVLLPSCGQCRFCVVGRPNLCVLRDKPRHVLLDGSPRFSLKGRPVYHMHQLSCFAERSVVPQESLVSIREDAPLDRVCLIACSVATGVCAVLNRARVSPGSAVAVIGVGGVGLNVVQGSVMANAGRIIAVDINRKKLQIAEQFGATHLIDASRQDQVTSIRELTGGWGADYAFEAVGLAGTMAQAIEATMRGGMTILLGIPPAGAQLTVRANMFLDEKTVTGSSLGGVRQQIDIPMLVDLYMAGKLKLDELISHRLHLEEINKGFDLLDRGESTRSIIDYSLL